MRTATKSTLGLVSLGLFAASYQIGLSAETGFSLSGSAPVASTSPEGSAASGTSAEPTPSSSASASTDAGASASTGEAAGSTSGTTTSTPAPKATSSTTTGGTTSTASVSKTSDAIDTGKGYGFVQVEVVKKGGVITEINMVRAEATDGRAGAFPSLVAAAVQANGTGFGNVSGATYTTKAFKKAVESALAKF